MSVFSSTFCSSHPIPTSILSEKGSSSHGILAGPFSGSGLVLGSVSLVNVSDLGNQRVVRVRVSQQRADREEHLGDGEGWGPLILQDI